MQKTSELFNKEEDISHRLIQKLCTQTSSQHEARLIENYHEIALLTLNAGVWSYEIGQNQLHWSEKCFEITGINEIGATTDQFYSIIHPSDKARLKLMWSRITDVEGFFNLETRILRNEEVHWIKISGYYQKISNNPNLLNGIMVDITEEKEFQEKLLESRSLFQSVVDDQTELICRFDAKRNMTFSNKAFRSFFNISPADKAGLPLKFFFQTAITFVFHALCAL